MDVYAADPPGGLATGAAVGAGAGLFVEGPAAVGGMFLKSAYLPEAAIAGFLGAMASGLTP